MLAYGFFLVIGCGSELTLYAFSYLRKVAVSSWPPVFPVDWEGGNWERLALSVPRRFPVACILEDTASTGALPGHN